MPEHFQSKTESQEATVRLNRRLEAKREGDGATKFPEAISKTLRDS